ncbi:MAG: polyprenyl synthetase family protein [Bdellovibrio sp.]
MEFPEQKEFFDQAVRDYFLQAAWPRHSAIEKLKEAVLYSIEKGGKRFRPVLALLFAEACGVSPRRVLPWALAVEMIHTYSLIHDDLPCMDDDDFRRGAPTNHKVFGEPIALLAGDALLTEAFRVLAVAFRSEPALAVDLIEMLSCRAGVYGMLAGQAIDMSIELSTELIEQGSEARKLLHDLKTGALIECSVVGSARICGLSDERVEQASLLGRALGLAFQIKDDILDSESDSEDLLWLKEITHQGSQSLQKLGLERSHFARVLDWNLQREH